MAHKCIISEVFMVESCLFVCSRPSHGNTASCSANIRSIFSSIVFKNVYYIYQFNQGVCSSSTGYPQYSIASFIWYPGASRLGSSETNFPVTSSWL